MRQAKLHHLIRGRNAERKGREKAMPGLDAICRILQYSRPWRSLAFLRSDRSTALPKRDAG